MISYIASLIGHGTNTIVDANGQGNRRSLKTRQIAELFAYHSPEGETKKTESTPKNLVGIEPRRF